MKSIINIFCVACLLGLIGCSHDYVQTDDAEKAKPVEVAVAAYDTTYLNLGVENAGFSNDDAKQAAAAMMQLKAVKTRALVLDGKGHVEDEQSFPAICFLRNKKTNQLGRFNLTWNVNAGGLKLVGNKESSFAVVWAKGTAPTSLSGDDWEVCAFAGGGQAMQKDGREVVSFDAIPNRASVAGALDVPFISDYSKVRILAVDGGQKSLIKFNFKLAGTLLKLKVKRDPVVTSDQRFYFRTNGIHRKGVFSLQSLDGNKIPLPKAEWSSELATDYKYDITLNASDAVKLSENGNNYYLWYIWGMPNKANMNVETTMVAPEGGYVIKQSGKQGPLVSTHKFGNDEGKIKTFNLIIHDREPYPGFNFLNIMDRVAEHNLEARQTWWESDKVKGVKKPSHGPKGKYSADQSVFINYNTAVMPDFMPEGYHLPSFDEMTVLFPYQGSTGDKDFIWTTDFTSKTDPWMEKVVLYAKQNAYLVEKQNVWGVFDNDASKRFIPADRGDIKDSYNLKNVPEFKSYIYNPNGGNVFYSIRFADNNNGYGNKIRCAYKWDFTKATGEDNTYQEGYVEITCRWIGDSPVTIDDITNDAWWQRNSRHNVVRRLPAQGEASGDNIGSATVSGTYLCANKYDMSKWGGNIFARQFNTKYKGGSIQRKNNNIIKGLVRPFKNTMMLKKK